MADDKKQVGIVSGLALLLALLALLLIGIGGMGRSCDGKQKPPLVAADGLDTATLEQRIVALEEQLAEAQAGEIAQTREALAMLAPDLPESAQPALATVLDALASLEAEVTGTARAVEPSVAASPADGD